jgi:phasin family protein
MISTPAQVAEFQKSQLDALFALSHTMFEATEKLVDLNLAATKALLEESAERTQVMLGVKDAQELLAVGSGLAQPALEKVVSYNRNVYGIASGASADFSKIFETQISQSNKKVAEMIEFASKSTPTGAEPAVSMFKSAMAAANPAYDTFNKATKQAVDMAESNFNAATAATVKAANDVVKPVKARKAA